jgi:pimeloyl-ACP methyl ester carboxylesterase
MLCHGLAANSLQFVEDAAFFAAKGFRVIVPDLRGHGRSTCPDQRTDRDFSIQRLAAELIAILDPENIETIDWVGNSLGGIVALSLMETDRQRLGSFISFGTSYSLSVPMAGVNIGIWIYKILGPKLLAKMGAPLTSRDKKARAIIYAMLCEMDMDAVAHTAKHLGQYDLTKQALEFDGPILMIQGERDTDVNRALKKTVPLMLERANFTLVDMKNAGHCANLDQPEKMRQIVMEFLGNS